MTEDQSIQIEKGTRLHCESTVEFAICISSQNLSRVKIKGYGKSFFMDMYLPKLRIVRTLRSVIVFRDRNRNVVNSLWTIKVFISKLVF